MSTKSNIEWTEFTWNPATGFTKISPGCKHCYAEVMADRLQAMGAPGYEHGFKLTLHPDRLTQPLKRKKPTTYFVNSMSDLFHEDIPFEYLDQVFEVIRQTPKIPILRPAAADTPTVIAIDRNAQHLAKNYDARRVQSPTKAIERQRIRRLKIALRDMETARRTRAYLEAMQANHSNDPKQAEWLAWVAQYADEIDPTI